jgi:hypothetical protein
VDLKRSACEGDQADRQTRGQEWGGDAGCRSTTMQTWTVGSPTGDPQGLRKRPSRKCTTVLEGSHRRHRQLHLSGTLAVTGPLAGQRRRRSSPWGHQRRRAQEPLASQATLRSRDTGRGRRDHGVKRCEAEQ